MAHSRRDGRSMVKQELSARQVVQEWVQVETRECGRYQRGRRQTEGRASDEAEAGKQARHPCVRQEVDFPQGCGVWGGAVPVSGQWG